MEWLSIFDFITKPLTKWLSNRGEVKAAEHVRELAIINNQSRLASDTASYNHQWEMASLKNQDVNLRWFSFVLFASPIVITVVSPEHGAIIWINLKLVPEWFVAVFVVMIGGIWGIAELKQALPQMLSAFKGSK